MTTGGTHELLSTPTPRPEDVVDRCVADATRRTKRLAMSVSIGLCAMVVVGIVVVGILALEDPTIATREIVQVGVLVAIFGIVIPVCGVRWVILRDVKALRRLARDGIARRPIRIQEGVSAYLEKLCWLGWDEDGTEATGFFETRTQQLAPVRIDQIVVVARPRDAFVLAVLGTNGVFVGKRQRVLGQPRPALRK